MRFGVERSKGFRGKGFPCPFYVKIKDADSVQETVPGFWYPEE